MQGTPQTCGAALQRDGVRFERQQCIHYAWPVRRIFHRDVVPGASLRPRARRIGDAPLACNLQRIRERCLRYVRAAPKID